MAGIESSEPGHAFVIAPVLVELGRTAELDAFAAAIDSPPHPTSVDQWHIVGHLMAGRPEQALERLRAIADPRTRSDAAYMATAELINSEKPQAARPLLPYFDGEAAYIQGKARLAAALRDLELARSLLPGIAAAPEKDRNFVTEAVIDALAQAGDWKAAVELVSSLPASDQGPRLAGIAAASGQVKVFAMLEKAMQDAPQGDARDRLRRLMVNSLLRAGYVSAAAPYIEQAEGTYERETTLTFAAAALARTGHATEAVQIARSIPNRYRKAWAIWEVAENLDN